jgi:hypothetical protein
MSSFASHRPNPVLVSASHQGAPFRQRRLSPAIGIAMGRLFRSWPTASLAPWAMPLLACLAFYYLG